MHTTMDTTNDNKDRGSNIGPQNSSSTGQPWDATHNYLPAATGHQLVPEEGIALDSGMYNGSIVTSSNNSSNNNVNDEGEEIRHPNANDVLFGRGRPLQNHPGNLRFHKIVNRNREAYVNSRKEHKITVARKVFNDIKGSETTSSSAVDGGDATAVTTDNGSSRNGGRFLKKTDSGGNYWVNVSILAAIEKISHALRGRPRSETRNCVGQTKPGANKRASNGSNTTTTTVRNGGDGKKKRKGPPSHSNSTQDSTVSGITTDIVNSTGLFPNNAMSTAINGHPPTIHSSSQVQAPGTTVNQQHLNFVNQQLSLQAIHRQNQLVSVQQQQVLQQLGGQQPLVLNQQIQQLWGQQTIQSQAQNQFPLPQQALLQQLLTLQQGNHPQQAANLQQQLTALLSCQQQQNQHQHQQVQQGTTQLHQLQQQQQQPHGQLLPYSQIPPLSTTTPTNNNTDNNIATSTNVAGGGNPNAGGTNLGNNTNSVINNPASGNFTEAIIMGAAAILASQQQQQSHNPSNPQITQGQQQQQQQQQQALLLAALMQGKQQQ